MVQDTLPIEVETVEDEDEENSTAEPTDQDSDAKNFLRSATKDMEKGNTEMPTINMDELICRTFITSPDADGEQKHAQIEGVTFLQQKMADKMEPLIKFRCKVGEKRFEEVMTYNRMLQWCDQHKDSGEFYRLVKINGHCKLKNGKYQVRVLWASGLRDWRDMDIIFEDDPVTLAA